MSSTASVRRMVDPSDEEVRRAAEVLASAFCDNVMIRAFVGGEVDLLQTFFESQVRAALIGGEAYVVGFGEDKAIHGVALWFGPDQALFSTEEQRAAGWNDLFPKLKPEVGGWWMQYFLPAYGGKGEEILGQNVKLKAWHLLLIGVVTEQRNKGLGSSLIKTVQAKTHSTKTDMVLECMDFMIDYYKRFGFEVKGKANFTSPEGDWDLNYLLNPPPA